MLIVLLVNIQRAASVVEIDGRNLNLFQNQLHQKSIDPFHEFQNQYLKWVLIFHSILNTMAFRVVPIDSPRADSATDTSGREFHHQPMKRLDLRVADRK